MKHTGKAVFAAMEASGHKGHVNDVTEGYIADAAKLMEHVEALIGYAQVYFIDHVGLQDGWALMIPGLGDEDFVSDYSLTPWIEAAVEAAYEEAR